jgi:peptide/nickel transport system substrate-binding protein
MTSADVLFSLDIQRDPGATSAVNFTSVKNVTAPDRYTVIITLKHPDASFPYELAYGGSIFEKSFYQANPDTFGDPGRLVMATGPYSIDKYDPLTGLDLSANPNYWGSKPRVQHLSFKVFADETSAALAFRAGDIDVFLPYGPKAFATTSGAKLQSVPSLAMTYLFMNYHRTPFSDVHVRRAVAYAVKRPDLMTVAGGYNQPAYTFIPPQQLGTLGSPSAVSKVLASLPKYPYSLAKAKAEMAKSKYPKGFTVTTQTIASYQPHHEVLADQLKAIGIKLVTKTVDTPKWLAAARGPKTYALLFTGWAEISPDPAEFPNHLLKKINVSQKTGSGTNFANYDPLAADKLIAAGVATTDPTKRLAIYGALLRRMQLDMPVLPLYLTNQTLAISGKYRWPGFDYYDTLRPWALDIVPN